MSLKSADLQGATIRFAFVWRAKEPSLDTVGLKVQDIIAKPERHCLEREKAGADGNCQWSKADFEALKQAIRTTVPEVRRDEDEALQPIDLLDPDPALDSDRAIEAAWQWRQDRSPPTAEFEEARSKVWKEMGCAADGAPFVVAALVERLRSEFANDSPHPAQIAAAFMRDDCAGASGISASTRAKLTELKMQAPRATATPAAVKP